MSNGIFGKGAVRSTTKLIGGIQFVNGTLVTPWSTIDGANAWLNAKNLPYHMEGFYSFNPTGVVRSLLTSVNPVSLIGFTQMTWNAESIVRRSIWNDGHPAMMLFAYDNVPDNENLGAHYVPTYAYKIYENPFYTDVYTYSDFVTDPHASDPWINTTRSALASS